MNKQKSQEQKDYYNKTAKDYDKWHIETASAKIIDAWNFKNLKKFVNNKKINKALDLACGTGRISNNLLNISDQVYGVDISEEVLKIAKQKYPQLKLTQSEVTNLPYDNNYFDLVIINGSLHHFFAVEETLTEAYRVLKPGGLFVLLGEPNQNYLKFYNPFFYFWALSRVFIKISDIFKTKKSSPPELIEPDAENYKPNKLKKQLTAAGFDIKQFYTYDYFHRFENKLFLKNYYNYLEFEHRTIAKIFKNLGAAIQCVAYKNNIRCRK
jgi:demethylmenaquinone methyltransferase / 2-methoxy-6-polyprenyl-1,4-benzoquinol methylase